MKMKESPIKYGFIKTLFLLMFVDRRYVTQKQTDDQLKAQGRLATEKYAPQIHDL